jgi:hypothetical protein
MEDIPGLSGMMRIFIYGSLLLNYVLSVTFPEKDGWWFGTDTSPWSSAAQYEQIHDSGFFEFEGLGHLLGYWWVSIRNLRVLTIISIVSWICCVLGFAGHLPVIVLGITSFLLFAVCGSTCGIGHRWYANVYTFMILMLSNGNHEYAVDSYLFELYPTTYWFPPTNNVVLRSGMGRKLVWAAVISTLFNGGLSKMWTSGLRWMDGKSLAYYTQIKTSGRFTGAMTFMKTLIRDIPVVSAILSIKTMIFQLSSISTLFVPFLRFPFILIAWGFHFGIWLTMNPNYLPQSLCYVVGTHWNFEGPIHIPQISNQDNHQAIIASIAASCFTAMIYFFGIIHFETWPFTCVPMYAPYRDLAVFSHDHLKDEGKLHICEFILIFTLLFFSYTRFMTSDVPFCCLVISGNVTCISISISIKY